MTSMPVKMRPRRFSSGPMRAQISLSRAVSAVFSGFVARGAARLPATGAWRAVLTAGDGRAEPLTGELALSVTTDGPNLLYLGFLGFLSGGSVLYGWTRRRRAASRD